MAQEHPPRSLAGSLRHSATKAVAWLGIIESPDGAYTQDLPSVQGEDSLDTSQPAKKITITEADLSPIERSEQAGSAEKRRWQLDSAYAEKSTKTVSEDVILAKNDMGLFAVFDGMGGDVGGDVAARAAREGVYKAYHDFNFPEGPQTQEDAIERMKLAFAQARSEVVEALQSELLPGEFGGTTAIVTKFEVIDGELYMVWGNAGDSRLFAQEHLSAPIESLATEQIRNTGLHRNVVLNALTNRPPKEHSVKDEFGIVRVKDSFRIMLCSDGITGDTDKEALTDDEMREGFGARTTQESADTFLSLSKKRDDKSVIVIDVIEPKVREDRAVKAVTKVMGTSAPASVVKAPSFEQHGNKEDTEVKPLWWERPDEDEEPAPNTYSPNTIYTAENWWKDSLQPRLKQLFNQGRNIVEPILAAKFHEAKGKLTDPDNRHKVALGLLATGATLYGASKLGLTPGRRRKHKRTSSNG